MLKLLNRVKLCALWWPTHVWKWCLMFTELLFYNLSLMNFSVLFLEHVCAIREGKIY